MSTGLRIALVAGEASGDLLGANLIRALRATGAEVEFAGVAGSAMQEEGCEAWWNASELSVMGLGEVLVHLPRLLTLRRRLARRIVDWEPHVFVGIDAPDFNLGLERRVRKAGVPTIQYVSPSVWAWRPGRVHTVAECANRVLCLLPFEKAFYDQHNVDAVFVGHPLADQVPVSDQRTVGRTTLGLDDESEVITVMPGSRSTEVASLGPLFAQTIALVASHREGVQFVAPMARPDLRTAFGAALAEHAPDVQVQLLDGMPHLALAAADSVLVASGTATLEAMLFKRPMVVAYQVSRLTFWLLKILRLLNISRFALPNLLAGEDLVPEFIQHQAQPPAMAEALLRQLDDADGRQSLVGRFTSLHQQLRCSAGEQAAQAVLELARKE
ncbi:MAG: lipid-A-disaccharide synthase [Pseudomonadota bacterium]